MEFTVDRRAFKHASEQSKIRYRCPPQDWVGMIEITQAFLWIPRSTWGRRASWKNVRKRCHSFRNIIQAGLNFETPTHSQVNNTNNNNNTRNIEYFKTDDVPFDIQLRHMHFKTNIFHK